MEEHIIDRKQIEAEEDIVIDLQFLVEDLMVKKRVSRKELAARTGISVQRLSQLFSAEANPNCKTFARLVFALGEKIEVRVSDGKIVEERTAPANVDWEFSTDAAAIETSKPSKRDNMLRFARVAKPSNDNPAPGRVERYLDTQIEEAA